MPSAKPGSVRGRNRTCVSIPEGPGSCHLSYPHKASRPLKGGWPISRRVFRPQRRVGHCHNERQLRGIKAPIASPSSLLSLPLREVLSPVEGGQSSALLWRHVTAKGVAGSLKNLPLCIKAPPSALSPKRPAARVPALQPTLQSALRGRFGCCRVLRCRFARGYAEPLTR